MAVVFTERLHVPVALLRNIRAHALSNPEVECCGMLGGDASHAVMLIRCSNHAMNPRESFKIDQYQRYRAEMSFLERGARHVGVYHSHPRHPARPSQADLAMIPSELVSLIYSCADDEVLAWRGATQVDLEVIR